MLYLPTRRPAACRSVTNTLVFRRSQTLQACSSLPIDQCSAVTVSCRPFSAMLPQVLATAILAWINVTQCVTVREKFRGMIATQMGQHNYMCT
jgi:hypothetical protein